MNSTNFDHVNDYLHSRREQILSEWLPGGKIIGNEYVCGDITGGPGQSFKFNMEKRIWTDFAGNEGGGDYVSLYAEIHQLSQGEALKELVEKYNIDLPSHAPSRAKAKKKDEWIVIRPIPENAQQPSFHHPQYGLPDAHWLYNDEHGRPEGFACRFTSSDLDDNGKPKKVVIPYSYWRNSTGACKWRWKKWADKRALYGVDTLATRPGDAVLIVEGEKTTDAARLKTPTCIATWPGGSGAVHKVDWSSLKGRRVCIFPDNDEPGFKAAIEIGGMADEIGFELAGIVLPDTNWSEGADIADFPEWTQADLNHEIATRKRDLDQFKEEATKRYPKLADSEEWGEVVPFDSMDLPAIPSDSLPDGPIKRFLEAMCISFQVPFEIAFMTVLGIIATAMQGKVEVAPKGIDDDYRESLNLYALIGLDPGERKSTVVKACKAPLSDWLKSEILRQAPIIEEQTEKRKAMKKRIAHLQKEYAKGDDTALEEINKIKREMPEEQHFPRLFADDVTSEALARILEEQDEKISIIEAEGGIFETLAGRYSSGVPNIDIALKGWSGETVTIDRRDGGNVTIESPLITMVLCIQPGVIRELGKKPGFRDRGMVARFLFCLPKSRLGIRPTKTPRIPAPVKREYKEIVERLLNFTTDKPKSITLTDDAFTVWESYCDTNEIELKPGGGFDGMSDIGSKFTGQVIRLAGLLHVAHSSDPLAPIEADTMTRAVGVIKSLGEHAKAAIDLMGANKEVACASEVLNWMKCKRFTGGTARDIHQALRRRFDPNDIKSGLEELKERGYVKLTGKAANSTQVTVNPAIHK